MKDMWGSVGLGSSVVASVVIDVCRIWYIEILLVKLNYINTSIYFNTVVESGTSWVVLIVDVTVDWLIKKNSVSQTKLYKYFDIFQYRRGIRYFLSATDCWCRWWLASWAHPVDTAVAGRYLFRIETLVTQKIVVELNGWLILTILFFVFFVLGGFLKLIIVIIKRHE